MQGRNYQQYGAQAAARSPSQVPPQRRGPGKILFLQGMGSSLSSIEGHMIPNVGQSVPNMSTQQQKAREEAQKAASDKAKLRSRKPTDQNLPDGLEDIVLVPELVGQYKRLQEMNREIDAIMARKRLDIIDAVNRPNSVRNIMSHWEHDL